ncbi:hypothetical protein C7974DRAFT_196713 [Boeremia exigua]|uniref:uncharacterized protein n=1 Tax=Boeremia exigua TaxID=749465 RepID=UPI001E8CAABE|nr:uncharacterized protein C7974DRAFT_196713 [Boeremia exigua]KAH6625240.1 hypothetical protein C7974DRAFT_196713 [Boeremia exigua]
MHTSSLSAAIYGVLFVGLAAATGGEISLSNFTPRIDNLPTQCKTVYNTKIDACVSSDFTLGATCSSGCLAGLAKIATAVKTGCVGVDVGETSIIGVFQNNLGVAALCPNNKQSSSSTSSSSPATTSATLQTSTRTSAPATTTAAPSTSTVRPSSASSSGLNLDTTATLATSTTIAAPTSSATIGTGVNSQLSNSDSGGGSPFDVVATGAAPQLHLTKTALSTLLASILLVVLA